MFKLPLSVEVSTQFSLEIQQESVNNNPFRFFYVVPPFYVHFLDLFTTDRF